MRNDHAELWNRSSLALKSSPAACTAGAHEARAQCAKQREVSPMKQGVPQASLRAQWYDHAELRGRMGSQYAAAENPIFQSKNRFLAVSAPENPQDFSGN